MNEVLLKPFNNCIKELKEFLKVKDLKYKNRAEASNAVASFFRMINPKTEREYDNFYKLCDDYVYENVYCNSENSVKQRAKKVLQVLNENNIKTILEIGIGVGSYAIALAELGFDVSVLRSDNLAFRFFEERNKKYGSKVKIIDGLKEMQFDCILHFDVIEHIVDPFSFIDFISTHTKSTLFTHGLGIHSEKMGGYPQHFDFKINDIKKHFEKNGFIKTKVSCPIFPPHFYKLKGGD